MSRNHHLCFGTSPGIPFKSVHTNCASICQFTVHIVTGWESDDMCCDCCCSHGKRESLPQSALWSRMKVTQRLGSEPGISHYSRFQQGSGCSQALTLHLNHVSLSSKSPESPCSKMDEFLLRWSRWERELWSRELPLLGTPSAHLWAIPNGKAGRSGSTAAGRSMGCAVRRETGLRGQALFLGESPPFKKVTISLFR